MQTNDNTDNEQHTSNEQHINHSPHEEKLSNSAHNGTANTVLTDNIQNSLEATTKIDESLYSRQLYVLGTEAMERMINSTVLIIGMTGLGTEICKNLCLTGIKTLLIYDNENVKIQDLGTGFYYNEKDVGRKRTCAIEKLRELNHYVNIYDINSHIIKASQKNGCEKIDTDRKLIDSGVIQNGNQEFTIDEVLKHTFQSFKVTLVISCDAHINAQIKINNLCRANNILFIACQQRGVSGFIFNDFLDEFSVNDTTGEEKITGNIQSINKDGVVTLVEKRRHDLESGEIVRIIHPAYAIHDLKNDSNALDSNEIEDDSNEKKDDSNEKKDDSNEKKDDSNEIKDDSYGIKDDSNEIKDDSNDIKEVFVDICKDKSDIIIKHYQYFTVDVIDPLRFKLVRDEAAGENKPLPFIEISGGTFEQVKKPKILSFKNMEDAIKHRLICRDNLITENTVNGKPINDNIQEVMMNCYVALGNYYENYGRYPEIGNDFDKKSFVKHYIQAYKNEVSVIETSNDKYSGDDCSRTLMGKYPYGEECLKEGEPNEIEDKKITLQENSNSPIPDIDGEDKFTNDELKKFIIKFAERSIANFMPVTSIIGGFAAQEALKAISGKFMPLDQFLFLDFDDAIPDEINYDFESYINEKLMSISKDNGEKIHFEGPKSENETYMERQRRLQNNLAKMINTRYFSLLYLLGPYLVEKIHKTNIFLIGAGAIGCEHVKNFAMLGMGSRGLISITDMDSIENSNLNRQFLFKKPDVGRMKSEIAMRELKKLNPDIKVKNYNIKFDNSNISESFFTDEFLMSQTFIANALDNVDSRLYVDDRCVLLRKAFFDSGTLGTKGNSQPIIPFMTESYSSTRDPPEKSIPLCTIRNFPHAIEHTIEWALSEFTSLFYNDVLSIKSFVDEIFEEVDIPNSHRSKTEYGESKIIDNNEFSSVCNENKQKVGVDNTTNVSFDSKKLKEMIRLITESPHDTDTAIKKSILLFVDLFCDKIHQLIKAFPPDHITEEGLKFWSPPKQAPSPISFDITNNKHVMFVESCANIFKQAFNIKGKIDKEAVIDYYHKELVWENDMINDKEEDFHKTEFEKVSLKKIYFEKVLKEKVKARTGVRSSSKMIKRKNAADNSYDKNNFGDDNIVFCLSSDDEDDSSNCIIPGYSKEKFFKKMTPGDKDYLDSILNNLKNITPIEFEKDNDLNYHVSFVYAAANLRADNYGIQNADRLKIKGIAGRIIPAIATTTAVISGLNVIEMIKYIFKLKTYKNSFINLALPFIGFSEPPAPEKYKCRFVEKVKEDKEEPKDEKSDFEEDETKDEKDENRDTLEFTIWDQFEFKDCTLAEMISFFKNHEKIVSMVTFGSKILYSSFYNKEEYDQNLSKRISELVPEKRIIKLDILFDGDDDGDQLPVTVVHIC